MNWDSINNVIWNHVLAEPGVAAALAAFVFNIDRVILFSLRFFSPETLKAEVDRIDAAVKARIDKDAAQANVPPAPPAK